MPPAPSPATTPEPPLVKYSRTPIPTRASWIAAEKLFQELFHADLMQAKLPEQKAALAGKLLRQADAVRNDPTSRYVMLQESLRLSEDASDMAILGRAINSLARMYVVDASLIWIDALEKEKSCKSHECQRKTTRLAEACADQADEAAADDNYELAPALPKCWRWQRHKSRRMPHSSRMLWQAARAWWRRSSSGTPQQQGHSVLAQTSCATRPRIWRWENTSVLPRGSGIRDLFDWPREAIRSWPIWRFKSLANPNNPAAQECPRRRLVESGQKPRKVRPRRSFWRWGAEFWYSEALPRLAGLAKSKVEGRLHSLPAPSPNAAKPALRRWMRDVAALPAEQQVVAVRQEAAGTESQI